MCRRVLSSSRQPSLESARTERSQKLAALESHPLKHVTVNLSSLCPSYTAEGTVWNAAQILLEQLGCRWRGKLKAISSSPSALLNRNGAKTKTFPIHRKEEQGKRDCRIQAVLGLFKWIFGSKLGSEGRVSASASFLLTHHLIFMVMSQTSPCPCSALLRGRTRPSSLSASVSFYFSKL